MNRIQPFADALESQLASSLQPKYSIDDDPATDHACFMPLHYEAGYAYPLVVWLHGAGQSEQQLKRIMPSVSMRNYVAVAPRGTLCQTLSSGQEGYHWQQSGQHIELASQRVQSCIEMAQERFNIAPSRIFLAGFGSGGTMALRVALNHPQQFAGALSLGGAFPHGHCPLSRLDQVRKLPLFLATGLESEDYPLGQVCRDLRLFHAAGLSVTLRHYPCRDDLTTLMLGDVNRWMMELVCPSSASCPSSR